MKDPTRRDDALFAELARLAEQVRQLTVRRQPVRSLVRPDPVGVGMGAQWWDPALARPIWSDGQGWRFSDGSPA